MNSPHSYSSDKALAEYVLVMERVKTTLRHRIHSPWAQELLRYIEDAEGRITATNGSQA
jgi:hypothetical protein